MVFWLIRSREPSIRSRAVEPGMSLLVVSLIGAAQGHSRAYIHSKGDHLPVIAIGIYLQPSAQFQNIKATKRMCHLSRGAITARPTYRIVRRSVPNIVHSTTPRLINCAYGEYAYAKANMHLVGHPGSKTLMIDSTPAIWGSPVLILVLSGTSHDATFAVKPACSCLPAWQLKSFTMSDVMGMPCPRR
ncbi:hypothetical protein GGR57DRAFT_41932 [Xylariaceae sp. FL1272]|nr:hypothetical protein GGR57DRAFT_41932 [Xylariaceae sp. FL1272]